MSIKIISLLNQKVESLERRIFILKLKINNLFKSEVGVNKYEERSKKIVVSLTTYPKRFKAVYLTLETLLSQEKKPDKIILYLSKEETSEYDVPRKISRLKRRGIEIRFVDGNLRSYKKLIYVLKEHPNDLIITVDDDILYPSYFIEDIYNKYLQYEDCIVAYRCSVMVKKDEKSLMPYLTWKSAKNCSTPSYNLFFTGVGGVLYPPHALDQEVFNKDLFMKLSPTADDVWFKAMSLLKRTKVVQVYKDMKEFPIINGSQEDALWKINNEQNHNDIQLKQVFDYFDLYQHIDEGKNE